MVSLKKKKRKRKEPVIGHLLPKNFQKLYFINVDCGHSNPRLIEEQSNPNSIQEAGQRSALQFYEGHNPAGFMVTGT